MKRQFTNQPRSVMRGPVPTPDRRGSVLLVMLGLLLLLMILGFAALTYTSQEYESALYYSESAKPTVAELPADALFDYALEQLIVGPRDTNYQSTLWPGRHSLVPNMLGLFRTHPLVTTGETIPHDLNPFNGVAIGYYDVNGTVAAVPNPNLAGVNLLNSNYSPAAIDPALSSLLVNPGTGRIDRNLLFQIPQLASLIAGDPDYTYPDINNLFLGYVGTIQQTASSGGGAVTNLPVVIPSFHRPQYLERNGASGAANALWEVDPAKKGLVLRPHPGHQLLDTTGLPVRVARNNGRLVVSNGQGSFTLSRFLGTGLDGLPGVANVDDDQNNVVDDASELGFPNSDDTFQPNDYSERNPIADQVSRSQGIWTAHLSGSIDPTTAAQWELDVDNRNSGVRDGVWLDLGHPAITLPDGRQIVPMFSFSVLPADGLINLNTAGNIAGLSSGSMDLSPASLDTAPVSRSNFGYSASEINPLWALTATPQSVSTGQLYQHQGFLLQPLASGLSSRVQLANLESLFLLWGRPSLSVTSGNNPYQFRDVIAGRWGEATATRAEWLTRAQNSQPANWTSFPRPGRRVDNILGTYAPATTGDDDLNQWTNIATTSSGQATFNGLHPQHPNTNTVLVGLPTTYNLGQPFDYSGAGEWLNPVTGPNPSGFSTALSNQATISAALAIAGLPADPNTPVRWPIYEKFAAGSAWGTNLSGALASQPLSIGNLDHPAEMLVDRNYRNPTSDDRLFPADENFALHAAANDYQAAAVGSRVRQLAPANFEADANAHEIRRRFTTDSWDQTTHSFVPHRPVSNGETYATEVGFYPDANSATGGVLEFPPLPSALGTATQFDPFRPAVRATIGVADRPFATAAPILPTNVSGTTTRPIHQGRRLNLNRLATVFARVGGSTFIEQSPYQMPNPPVVGSRRLTPHPLSLPSTRVPTTPSVSYETMAQALFNGNTVNPLDQEFWARRDRQQMARDIYVMLYTLGGTAGNPLNTANAYPHWQLQQMAQFAVNVVDELDPDDVITKFEFDTNLSNGWNHDDNPYGPAENQDRTLTLNGQQVDAVVYGVEAQMLTLSEVLLLYQPQLTPSGENHNATVYNDSDTNRWFTHVELRNASPYSVNLASGSWRLSVQRQGTTPIGPVAGANELLSSVVFKRNGRQNSTTILPNGIYTIGTMGRDDRQLDQFVSGGNPIVRSADLRLDLTEDGDENFTRISPRIPEANPPTSTDDAPPGCDLDLVHNRDYNKNFYQLIDYAGGALDVSTDPQFRGGFLRSPDSAPIPLDPAQPITLVLERRANGQRTHSAVLDPNYDDDNPWIKVDQFTLAATEILRFELEDGSEPLPAVVAKLAALATPERSSPLIRGQKRPSPPTGGVALPNSISQTNTVQIAPDTDFLVWQPHFDRDFASVLDLLRIPLYGPHQTTARLAESNRLLQQIVLNNPVGQAGADLEPNPVATIAAAKFLQPTHPSNTDPNSADATQDNRWHRVLELFEVTSPYKESVSAQVAGLLSDYVRRVPGKINLNALSSPEVLYSMLDDPLTFRLPTAPGGLVADSKDSSRDWWYEFQRARDGQRTQASDPYSQLSLPGAASSRPFRGLSVFAGDEINALGQLQPQSGVTRDGLLREGTEYSLLRSLPFDRASNSNNLPATNYSQTANSYRRLWEARLQTDVTQSQANLVDPVARHRLLAKVANHATTRGHVFNVWMTVGFFEAYQPVTGRPDLVQIGRKVGDIPNRRAFAVIDRSQWQQGLLVNTNVLTFRNWSKLVQYRRTLD